MRQIYATAGLVARKMIGLPLSLDSAGAAVVPRIADSVGDGSAGFTIVERVVGLRVLMDLPAY